MTYNVFGGTLSLTQSINLSFILTLRLGCMAKPFHHRRFSLAYWTDSMDSFNHLMFLFCSMAGFVCMVF